MGKTMVTLMLGALFGVLLSPILLMLLSNDVPDQPLFLCPKISLNQLDVYTRDDANRSFLQSYSPHDALDVFTDQQLANNLVHVAILSSPRTPRTTALYYSFGLDLGEHLTIYTFPTYQASKKPVKKIHAQLPVKYMQLSENNTHVQLVKLLQQICQSSKVKYEYVLLARDDVYIQVDKLYKFLHSLPSTISPIYIGHRSEHGLHCSEGPVLLNKLTLHQACPYIQQCLTTQVTSTSEAQVLGNCLQNILGIKCWQPKQVEPLFYYDKANILTSSQLYTTDLFKQAITIHPVKDSAHLKTIHQLVSELRVKTLLKEASSVVDNVNRLEEAMQQTQKSKQWWLWHNAHINPKSKYELLVWNYFNASHMFQQHEHLPLLGLPQRYKTSINAALQIVTDRMNASGKSDPFLPPYILHDGFVTNEALGIEYVLQMSVRRKSSPLPQQYIAHVFLPFQSPGMSSYKPKLVLSQTIVNIVIPVAHYHNLVPFLELYEAECLRHNTSVHLHLVFFYHDELISKKLSQILDIYQTAKIDKYEITSHSYSPFYAYNYIAELLSDNQLLLFFDMTLHFSLNFLEHCRMNTIKGKQVFSPILFSFYKPDIVQKYASNVKHGSISSETGFFVRYNYQVTSIYRSDYAKVGGFKRSKGSSGSDDKHFLENILKSDIYLMRAIEPFLTRIYKPRNCKKLKTKASQEMCMNSVADSIGNKKILGSYILHNGILDSQL